MAVNYPHPKVIAIGAGLATLTTALFAFAAPAPSNAPVPRPATPPAPEVRPAPPAPGIVARVNGQDITQDELLTLLVKRFGKATLEQLIDQKILEQAAQKQNVSVTPKDMDLQYEVYKTSQAQMLQSLEGQYGKDYLMQNMIKPGVIVKKIGETLVKVDPADLAEIRASHILIVPDSKITDPAKADAEARKIAEQVAADVRKPGADFGELARKHSKDTGSAANGGDLGFFGKGRMVPPFEEAAFKANVGEIVGPVKTEYGYHIIKVTDRKDASKLTPVEREQKREQIIMSKAREPIQQWITKQKQEAKVERYDLDQIKTAAR
ncbi:MAG: peptidylprolyl isomerase [Armatimonadetes bacterium]|nr:peptidylprolyl isomerase [Armatimonadota bacterium]